MSNSLIKLGKKTLTAAVTVTTILWSVGVAGLPLVAKAAVPSAPALIKATQASVYYLGTDGKRYVFPNETTYFTWYTDFSGETTISDSELANIAIGGNVTMRPGSYLAKITTDPKTYWVGLGGTLRHVTSEADAVKLYGSNWNKMVKDVPDAFFFSYKVGTPLDSASLLDDGMLFRTSAGGQVYLLDGGKARPVTADGMAANKFQDKFVQMRSDLSVAAAALSMGTPVTGFEAKFASLNGMASGTPAPAPVSGGSVNVALDPTSPAPASLIASAGVGGQVALVAKFMLSTGSQAAKITGLKLTRNGITSDGGIQ